VVNVAVNSRQHFLVRQAERIRMLDEPRRVRLAFCARATSVTVAISTLAPMFRPS